MESLADELRAENRAIVSRMSVRERIELALHLGDEDIALYARCSGLDPSEARRRVVARRQSGRTPSACMTDLR